MSDETPEIQKVYTVEEMFNMAQTKKPFQSNGRGPGLWLFSWGAIMWAFEWWVGMSGWLMWTWRITWLLLLLLGALGIAFSFDKRREE